MKIDIKDILGAIPTIQPPHGRIGLPDDPTVVDITDPVRLCKCLDDALRAFKNLRGGLYLVSAAVNTYHRIVHVRFVQPGKSADGNNAMEPALRRPFQTLSAELRANGGELDYWGGNNYFDVSLPFRGPMRESFPEVDHLPWDEHYRELLALASWESLRRMVFRFSKLAESFSVRCAEFGIERVLIPSVGLCVHPWLFASRQRSVIATDVAASAIDVLSQPEHWPQLYSQAAFERWDIAQSAAFATQRNPWHFSAMPDLGSVTMREALRQRITFATADWANLPLGNGAVDALFATNALPRESTEEQTAVLKEWCRVVRPGGLVFIAMHNWFDSGSESTLTKAGWIQSNLLRGERPGPPGATTFEIYRSSG